MNNVPGGNRKKGACLEQASNAQRGDKWIQDPFGPIAGSMSKRIYGQITNTHVFEVSSSVIMSPHPRVMIAHATHMTGRHLPVREMTWPETMDIKAPEREKGNILYVYVSILEQWNDVKELAARRHQWRKNRALGSTPAGSTSPRRSRRRGRKR